LLKYAGIASRKAECNVRIALARLAARRHDFEESRRLASRALEDSRDLRFQRGTALAHEELGDLARTNDDLDTAEQNYRSALAIADAIAPEGDLAYEIAWRLALVECSRGRITEAHSLVERSITLSTRHSDRREHANALVARARIHEREGATESARSDVRAAIDMLRQLDLPFELARAHEAAAAIAGVCFGPERTAHLIEAAQLYEALDVPDARRVLDALPRTTTTRRTPSHATDDPFRTIASQDPRMLEIIALSRRLASLDITILVDGESGTGKELIANAIHQSGHRADRPFVAVNCAALSEDLLESELFGHEKGAFTGATAQREGLLAAAKSGTVFLDEIDKSTLLFQSHLLRVLEERVVRPVGSNQTRPLDACVICATNKTPAELRQSPSFIPDLYYRLSEFRLSLPPLRSRSGDVQLLADHLLREASTRLGIESAGITNDALAVLLAYEWPGNVRELRNALVSSLVLAGGVPIQPTHLPSEVRGTRTRTDAGHLQQRVEEVERREIVAALQMAGGVKTAAAEILGVSRKGLTDRLKRLGLE
jgi:DNA-binding NtrC family response regulator